MSDNYLRPKSGKLSSRQLPLVSLPHQLLSIIRNPVAFDFLTPSGLDASMSRGRPESAAALRHAQLALSASSPLPASWLRKRLSALRLSC